MSAQWKVEQVQAGRLEEHVHDGTLWQTAIFKQVLEGPVMVDRFGVVGDEHTGNGPDLDRAICVHPAAHYAYWRAYFRRDIPLGFFGENLTVSGVIDEELCVGDIVRCGTTILQITQPRTPCYKPARILGEPTLVKLILQTGKLGFLMRVIHPGVLQAGDDFELLERPHPRANLVFVNRARYDQNCQNERQDLGTLVALADEWRKQFTR